MKQPETIASGLSTFMFQSRAVTACRGSATAHRDEAVASLASRDELARVAAEPRWVCIPARPCTGSLFAQSPCMFVCGFLNFHCSVSSSGFTMNTWAGKYANSVLGP